jgi:hypothetical protein
MNLPNEFSASIKQDRCGFQLYLFRETESHYEYVEKVGLTTRNPKDLGMNGIFLSKETAKDLMNDLWNLGIRPDLDDSPTIDRLLNIMEKMLD